MSPYTQKQIDRFWSNVDKGKADECWPWLRSINSRGYGQVGLRVGGVDRILKAHKVAWEIENKKEIPKGTVARHTCDTHDCCNPRHVIIGKDKVHSRAVLRREDAYRIRYKSDAYSTNELAGAFAVAYNTIWDIRHGITWKGV